MPGDCFFIAGILLAAAFMTKGFVALFPLVLPLLIWLFDRDRLSAKSMLLQTVSLLVGLLLPLAVIALSLAEMPVVVPSFASTLIVKQVPSGSVLRVIS